jgi:uncharacterized protein YigE (DUF2233 family)
MKKNKILIPIIFVAIVTLAYFIYQKCNRSKPEFITYTVNPHKDSLGLFWKNDAGELINSFEKLSKFALSKKKEIVFAMNAGMYMEDYTPLGLYINNHTIFHPINTAKGKGNFYMQPNGIFYLTDSLNPKICKTTDSIDFKKAKFATQSGPLIIIDGNINPLFKKGSNNLNIRNGVGILPNDSVVFVISKNEVNFYDFAAYFKSLGCKNALNFDGYVSKVYIPEKNIIKNKDYKFGVIVGVSRNQ